MSALPESYRVLMMRDGWGPWAWSWAAYQGPYYRFAWGGAWTQVAAERKARRAIAKRRAHEAIPVITIEVEE